MQLMMDGGFGELQILDSSKYRTLYIAKVYEQVPKAEIQMNAKNPV